MKNNIADILWEKGFRNDSNIDAGTRRVRGKGRGKSNRKAWLWDIFFHFQIFYAFENFEQCFRSYTTFLLKFCHIVWHVYIASKSFIFRKWRDLGLYWPQKVLSHVIKAWYYLEYVFNSYKLTMLKRLKLFV